MTAKNLAPIAASKVLELARVDGWFAVFDPSNPQYRELAEGRIASMSDVLGNLPEVRVEKPALQPDWVPSALNGMGAARHREQSVITLLTEVSFGEPMFIMMLAQFAAPGHHAAPGHPFDRQTIVDGQFGGDGRNIRGQGRLDQGTLHIDTDGLMSAVNDTKPHVFECQVGPDGESLAQGFFVGGSPEVGHGNDDGHDSFSRLAPGDPHSPGHPHSERVREGHEGRSGRDVYVGPVLVFRGVPPEGVRERMSRLLTSFTSESRRVRVDQLVSRTAIRTDVHGEVEFEKNPDKLEVPASLTKMLTAYLTRQTIGDDQLNERVTLTSEDHLKGSEPGLRVGDELTYLDLLYLAMLPSHNVASEILASRVGPKLVGTGRGYGRFLAEMNATIRKWGWQGAVFTNASGLGMSNRATARQMSELLWRIANEDATLLKIMGARTYDINVAGPHARTIKAVHTIHAKGSQRFPEFVAGKTGTLRVFGGNVAMLVDVGEERKVIVTMGAEPSKERYSDSRMILDETAEYLVSRSPEISDTANKLDQILEDLSSPLRRKIADIHDTQRVPRTAAVKIPGADLSAKGSRIVVTRSGDVVEMLVGAVKVPQNTVVSRAIPKGFRPMVFAFGSCTVRDGDRVRTVEIRVGASGQVSFFGNQSSDTLRGTFQWLTSDLPPE